MSTIKNLESPEPVPNGRIKRVILTVVGWAVFAVLLVFFVKRGSQVLEVLHQTKWQWLFIAVVMQIGNYLAAGFVLDNILQYFGHRLRFAALLRNSFMISYLNQTLPSWGMGGIAFLILDLKKEGVSPAKSMTGGIMFYALSAYNFFILLIVSFIGLFLNKQLNFIHVSAAFFAFIFVITVSVILIIVFFKREKFKKLVQFLLKPVHRLAHQPSVVSQNRQVLHEAVQTELVSEELQQTFRSLIKAGLSSWYIWAASLWSLTFHIFDILTVYAFFQGFGYPVSLSVLLGGFVLATVFGFISFIPGAVGVFETSMALVYSSLGVPFQVATLVALAFRGLGFWLPIPIGGWISKQFFHKTLKS